MSVQQARRLRRKLTDAERKLWSRLRNRQVANLKFRRQHPLGDWVVDFFCSEAKLAVELDGSGHASYRGQTSDLDREIELQPRVVGRDGPDATADGQSEAGAVAEGETELTRGG